MPRPFNRDRSICQDSKSTTKEPRGNHAERVRRRREGWLANPVEYETDGNPLRWGAKPLLLPRLPIKKAPTIRAQLPRRPTEHGWRRLDLENRVRGSGRHTRRSQFITPFPPSLADRPLRRRRASASASGFPAVLYDLCCLPTNSTTAIVFGGTKPRVVAEPSRSRASSCSGSVAWSFYWVQTRFKFGSKSTRP